jgi:hypothetical protein
VVYPNPELTHDSGPELDHASVSITLNGAKLLGSPVAYGPDPVHQIACTLNPGAQVIVKAAFALGFFN